MSKDTTELDFLGVLHKNFSLPQLQGPSRMTGSEMRLVNTDEAADTKPLTIFYEGRVTIFHLPNDKAENIMSLAEQEVEVLGGVAAAGNGEDQLLAKLREELPIASKRSLTRFFEKRKERLSKP